MIIISGMSDLPDAALSDRTPLMAAKVPMLDELARCGCCGTVMTVPEGINPGVSAAVLSLLGYDFSRGVPGEAELAAAGIGVPGTSLSRFFVVPTFSGHGAVVSENPVVRGIGRMAFLKSVNVEQLPDDFAQTLANQAEAALDAIRTNEFVLVFIDQPRLMSLKGDVDGKILALEYIDRYLIATVADYVWGAKEQMNLVVTTDCISSWRLRENVAGDVPAVVYFNDDLPYDTDSFDELSVMDGPLDVPCEGELIRKLITARGCEVPF